MPVGPLTLADEVGLDVGIKVLDCLEAGYGDRMAIPTFMKSLYADGKFLGKKSGSGFYVYEGKRKRPNAAVHESVRAFQTGDLADLSDTDVLHRCLFVMINEAARCLDEGVVSSARELDLAMVMGTGFPPFHGGLCRYTDAIGLAFVVERLYYFSRLYGSRFEPCKREK
jgi:3-hydroxyacyl-CoA dehydrogenase/enoyl-CoA hydratase/3-hydroxybutyryl-CoA epimerase